MSALACRKGIYQYLQSPQCVEGRTGRGSYQPSLERTRGGNRLGGRLELTRQLLGRASRSHQIDHLSPELRRISGSVAGHQTPQKSTSRVSIKPGQLHHRGLLTGPATHSRQKSYLLGTGNRAGGLRQCRAAESGRRVSSQAFQGTLAAGQRRPKRSRSGGSSLAQGRPLAS